MSVGYINFLPDKTIPTIFNPSTFKSTVSQSDSVVTQSLNVSSQSVTNGIDDYGTIDADNLIVNDTAVFNGTVIPNTNSIATANFVKTQINNLIGNNASELLNTITEINQALNNDPNFANTITTRIATSESNIANNTSSIATLQTNHNAPI
jgi:hypothetical protein